MFLISTHKGFFVGNEKYQLFWLKKKKKKYISEASDWGGSLLFLTPDVQKNSVFFVVFSCVFFFPCVSFPC